MVAYIVNNVYNMRRPTTDKGQAIHGQLGGGGGGVRAGGHYIRQPDISRV